MLQLEGSSIRITQQHIHMHETDFFIHILFIRTKPHSKDARPKQRRTSCWSCTQVHKIGGPMGVENIFSKGHACHHKGFQTPSEVSACYIESEKNSGHPQNRQMRRTAGSLCGIYKVAEEIVGRQRKTSAFSETRGAVEPSSRQFEYWHPSQVACRR